jgi:hypothetical protein
MLTSNIIQGSILVRSSLVVSSEALSTEMMALCTDQSNPLNPAGQEMVCHLTSPKWYQRAPLMVPSPHYISVT